MEERVKYVDIKNYLMLFVQWNIESSFDVRTPTEILLMRGFANWNDFSCAGIFDPTTMSHTK